MARAARYYEPGEHLGENGAPVEIPVIELETGDRLGVHGPDTFVPLSEREVQLVEGASSMLTSTITIVLRQANALKIKLPNAALLLLGVLKVSLRSLDLESRKIATPATPRPVPGG